MNHPPDSQSDERTRRQTELETPDTRYNDAFITQQSTFNLARQQRKPSPNDSVLNDRETRPLVVYNHITYLLYILSYFTAGLLWVVPIVMNYAKRHEVDGTWLATHFDWQIKTFWYSIVLFAIGIILIVFALGGVGISLMAGSDNIAIGSFLTAGLGVLILLFTFIWHLYRIVRGWVALADNRPVP